MSGLEIRVSGEQEIRLKDTRTIGYQVKEQKTEGSISGLEN